MKICSARLFGINCRYDGESKKNEKIIEMAKREVLIPVCPEQLGGLSTPREAAELNTNGKIITNKGVDVTENYIRGAEEVVKIAKMFSVNEAIMKQCSPSCGCGKIYLDGRIVAGDGITTKMLKSIGVNVISEEEI